MDNAVLVRPVRIVPFDLGAELTEEDLAGLDRYLNDHEYHNRVDSRASVLLEDYVRDGFICESLRYTIFSTGITVITVLEGELQIDDYEHFSLDYNANRKNAHSELFGWKHRFSSAVGEFIRDLRGIVHANHRTIRVSGSETFENKGMSYVMTIAFYRISDYEGQYVYSKLPPWFKKNVAATLDPSLLYLEDSAVFNNDFKGSKKKLSQIIDDIECEGDCLDYDTRKNITALMSWSAVMIIGEPSEQDVNDYIDLEVNLQSKWYHVYCLGHDIPKSLEDVRKRRLNGVTIQKSINLLESIADELYSFEDSSAPYRYLKINQGLVQTSGLEEMIRAYQKKLRHIAELMSLEDRERQKKYASTSEVLLLIIASLQILPIVSGQVPTDHAWVSFLIIGILIFVGAIIIHTKNKEW